jgi:ClpP class serine protease
VYSGDAAKRLGLVDHLGGFSSALARARQLAHVDEHAAVVVLPKRPSGLLDYIAPELSGASASTQNLVELLPAELRAALVRAAVMQRLGSETPLALLPYEVRY